MWRSRSTSASELLLGAWLLAALLTLVTADEVRSWLRNDERAGWAIGLGALAESVSDHLGLAAARDQLLALRSRLHGRRTVETAPPPPIVVQKPVAAPAPGQHAVAPVARNILLIGASSMQFGLGPELEAALGRYRDVKLKRFARSATGLSRPNEFDWPAKLDELLASFPADTVITNFGGNDATDIWIARGKEVSYGSAPWDRLFSERVAQLVERAAARGAHMVMIGMPIMRLRSFDERIRHLNALMREAAVRAGGDYVEQYDLSTTPTGGYLEEVTLGGQRRLLRASDGIHYTSFGGQYISAKLLPRIERVVRLVPRDPAVDSRP